MSEAGCPGDEASLDEWLAWQSSLHPREMDQGLERVEQVAHRLELLPFPAQVITVAGTNGKGSCALTLERLLCDQISVGVYTSPYIRRYNERVRINGVEASDTQLCAAFTAVEAVRGDVALTYFEFGTLAALWLFRQAALEVLVLEVGMGGRLDAVNVVDADIAVITSIALDHTQWLGDTREAIGHEKAGIMRAGRPVICADRDPPASIAAHASACGANLLQIGDDYDLVAADEQWQWTSGQGGELRMLPTGQLLADNLAAVLATLEQAGRLPDEARLQARLKDFSIPGRRQIIDGPVSLLLDVAHNPAAMSLLAQWLQAHPGAGRNICVLGMLRDKAIDECVHALAPAVDELIAAGLPAVERGADAAWLRDQSGISEVHSNVADALQAAGRLASPGDRIVVCGSFFTVSEALESLPEQHFHFSEEL